jgi:triphosphoribosyl-dephospho-CoA synthase
MPDFDNAKHVSQCLELAIMLEVSTDKPGNVSLNAGFEGTRVEHFLASAIAVTPYLEEAARRGILAARKDMRLQEIQVGNLIKDCTQAVKDWQKGGNTLLGTTMLLVPIAVAAGMTVTNGKSKIDIKELRKNLHDIIRATTAQDAVDVYEAIDIAQPSGLNQAPDLDVKNKQSKNRLLKENVTLYRVFEIASSYDDICSEWTNNFPIIFDLAYPMLVQQLEHNNLNTAVVQTFLKILSEHPDTFIARKAGIEKAKQISLKAKKIMELGGIETPEGKSQIALLDKELRKKGNALNPGTTADLTAAAIALVTMSGYRP